MNINPVFTILSTDVNGCTDSGIFIDNISINDDTNYR